MSSLAERLGGFFYDLDRAVNTLGGGSDEETISGTIGRGLERRHWWAPPLAECLNSVVAILTGKYNHCQRAAASEEKRRTA